MLNEVANAFERSVAYIQEQLADVPDDELATQPPGVRNHAAWTVGHVIVGCEAIAAELGGARWLPQGWERLFAYGSSPSDVRSQYPGKAELLARLADASQRLRTALADVDPANVCRPMGDEGIRRILPTLGDALVQLVVAHVAYHAGQLAVWRRATGRAPAGIFV